MGLNEFIKHRIGEEYLTRKAPAMQENTMVVEAAFKEISRINRELFEQIPYHVIFTTEDVYTSAKEMRERVKAEKIIYIYTGWSGHPFLTEEDNNIGRAVHDVWAHLVCGCSFSFEGELTAYNEQKNYYPKWTHPVLFAEIVGQTSAYYANKKSHDFEQRAIMALPHWIALAKQVKLPNFSHNSILAPFCKMATV